MEKPLAIVILVVIVVVMMSKFSESPGPRTASAVGNYDAVQPVIKPVDVYREPYSCRTTSHQGPYKWDGPTYSTVCK